MLPRGYACLVVGLETLCTLGGTQRGEQIISEAQKTAVAMKQKAEAEIAQEKKRALNDAKNEISEIAMAIASKVVGRELTADDHAKMVDNFIDELGGEV